MLCRGKRHSTLSSHFTNLLLSQYNLLIDDMQEVWGTPELATCDEYHSLNDYPGISYHSLCHLFSSLLLDSEIFYKEDVISLAVDGV